MGKLLRQTYSNENAKKILKCWEEVEINRKCPSPHFNAAESLLKRGALNSPQTLLGYDGTNLTQLKLCVHVKLNRTLVYYTVLDWI